MRSYWLDHDHLEVPAVATGEDDDQQITGDGMVSVTEDDPRFELWRPWALNARPDPDADADADADE